jgi:hypothetical protein
VQFGIDAAKVRATNKRTYNTERGMDEHFSVEFFSNRGLTVWRSQGYTRGHWNIVPSDSNVEPKHFPSLKSLWSWWFVEIHHAIHCELFAQAHVELWRRHSHRRGAIHRWIQSHGVESLDQEILWEVRSLMEKVDTAIKTRPSEFVHLLWDRPKPCVRSITRELLIAEERKLLAEATRFSPPEPRARRRM